METKPLAETPAENERRKKETYQNTLQEFDIALRERLHLSTSVIESKSFGGPEKDFDFAGATASMQNFLEVLKYFSERDADLTKVISNVSWGPKLAYDSSDSTLILSHGSTAYEIKNEINRAISLKLPVSPAINAGAPVNILETREFPETAEVFVAKEEKKLDVRIAERIAKGAGEAYEKFMSEARKTWALVPKWQRMFLVAELIVSSGVYMGNKKFEMDQKALNYYSDSQSTVGRKEQADKEIKPITPRSQAQKLISPEVASEPKKDIPTELNSQNMNVPTISGSGKEADKESTLFHNRHPLVESALINDINNIYSKKGLFRFGKKEGIKNKDWNSVKNLPAGEFMDFFGSKLKESNLNPELKKSLASVKEHKKLFTHISELVRTTGREMPPTVNENVEDYLRRVGAYIMSTSA